MNSGDEVVEFLNTDQTNKLGRSVLAKWRFRPNDAEDILQNARLSAWQSRKKWSPKYGTVSAWFCTIVHRRAMDFLKDNRRHTVQELYDGIPSKSPEPETDIKLANEIINSPDGDMFRLYVGGVQQKVLGLMFGITEANVQTRTWRFREQLRGLYPRLLGDQS